MNSTTFFLLSFLFLFINLHGQSVDVQSILSNKQVQWIQEVYIDYWFRKDMDERDEEGLIQSVIIKKSFHPESPFDFRNQSVYDHIWDYVKQEKALIYWDSDLMHPLSIKEKDSLLVPLDTIVTFDPETFEEIIQVVPNEIEVRDVRIIKLKQLLYYDKKALSFFAYPLSAAMVVDFYDDNGNYKESKPLFWIPIKAMTAYPNLENPSILWAKRSLRDIILYHRSDDKVVKDDMDYVTSLSHFFEQLAKQFNKKKTETLNGDLLSKAEFTEIMESEDTIITFYEEGMELPKNINSPNYTKIIHIPKNPKPGDEIILAIVNKLNPADIRTLRVLQTWFWDKETQQLGIYYHGFAPTMDYYMDSSNFIDKNPLFYCPVD